MKILLESPLFIIFMLAFIVVSILLAIKGVIKIFKSPFIYPYKKIFIDITSKRNIDRVKLIQRYLIKNGFEEFSAHNETVKIWKEECQQKIEKSVLKKLRNKQFLNAVDDDNIFRFEFVRVKTRYTQLNYVRTPYLTEIVDSVINCSFENLLSHYTALKSINFECSTSEYVSKNQRKLMTKELRREIALRDNYTCQLCGKYMPDGVGLQVDHIIPISKGGKSVPSNLQVLCSKCNSKKSSKIEI